MYNTIIGNKKGVNLVKRKEPGFLAEKKVFEVPMSVQ